MSPSDYSMKVPQKTSLLQQCKVSPSLIGRGKSIGLDWIVSRLKGVIPVSFFKASDSYRMKNVKSFQITNIDKSVHFLPSTLMFDLE